jgi:hypothetical protein
MGKSKINVKEEIVLFLSDKKEGATSDMFLLHAAKTYGKITGLSGVPRTLSGLLQEGRLMALVDKNEDTKTDEEKEEQRIYIHPSFKHLYRPSDLVKVIPKRQSPAERVAYQLYYALTEGNEQDKQNAISAYKKLKNNK